MKIPTRRAASGVPLLALAIAFAVLSARADVKNLSVGVNGVTCPT